jgi:hypothetical protein
MQIHIQDFSDACMGNVPADGSIPARNKYLVGKNY